MLAKDENARLKQPALKIACKWCSAAGIPLEEFELGPLNLVVAPFYSRKLRIVKRV
jgi:hypothetical protein